MPLHFGTLRKQRGSAAPIGSVCVGCASRREEAPRGGGSGPPRCDMRRDRKSTYATRMPRLRAPRGGFHRAADGGNEGGHPPLGQKMRGGSSCSKGQRHGYPHGFGCFPLREFAPAVGRLRARPMSFSRCTLPGVVRRRRGNGPRTRTPLLFDPPTSRSEGVEACRGEGGRGGLLAQGVVGSVWACPCCHGWIVFVACRP